MIPRFLSWALPTACFLAFVVGVVLVVAVTRT